MVRAVVLRVMTMLRDEPRARFRRHALPGAGRLFARPGSVLKREAKAAALREVHANDADNIFFHEAG